MAGGGQGDLLVVERETGAKDGDGEERLECGARVEPCLLIAQGHQRLAVGVKQYRRPIMDRLQDVSAAGSDQRNVGRQCHCRGGRAADVAGEGFTWYS